MEDCLTAAQKQVIGAKGRPKRAKKASQPAQHEANCARQKLKVRQRARNEAWWPLFRRKPSWKKNRSIVKNPQTPEDQIH